MDKLLLRFVLFLAKTFLKKDVDFERLKIITETKLLMDRRRVRVTIKRNDNNAEKKNQLLISQIVYLVFGLIIGMLIIEVDEILVAMILLHSYILFMMAMTLITDFSTVMLDTADNRIILPRPVTSQTLFVARLVHILVYLLQFTIALALLPLICTFVAFGPVVGIASFFTVILTVAFAVFITYLLYALILRFSSEEKIKDIISWFQIFMTVFFAVGYQVLPRLVNMSDLKIAYPLHWYAYLAPPVWMAMALQGLQRSFFDTMHIAMMVVAVLVPLLTFWVMIKFLAPSFAKKLEALGNSGDASTAKSAKTSASGKTYGGFLSRFLSTNKTEEAGFDLTWKMTARDKGFKIQFYPSMAYLLVFAFIFVFKSGKDIATVWATLSTTRSFLWFVYLPMFTISSAIMLVAYNENFTASWVYYSTPLYKPGGIISGAMKALLAKFFLPVFFLLFGFSLYVWGPAVIDDFVLGFFNNIAVFLLMTHFGATHLPFSAQPNVKQQTGKFIRVIVQMVIIGLVVVLHYGANRVPWLVTALIPVSACGCFFLFRMIQNYPWQKITRS